ncbi:MAG: ACP S-malonyltransferase [bacterium]|nr:ACP S-malonyltransferase [bacterium]
MSKPVIFMYSGQGSQLYHMGHELYEKEPVYRKWMEKLDGMARDIMGEPVLSSMYDKSKKKSDMFDHLRYSHPAIFMTEYALTRLLMENGIEPDFVLGTSMGEFASAAVSGVLSLEETLEAVIKQAEVLEANCEKGGMIAILKSPSLYTSEPLLSQHSELAGINFDEHFVIAGNSEPLGEIESYLRQEEILYQALPVNIGFHSPAIDTGKSIYVDYLKQKKFKKPEIEFISCSRAAILKELSDDYFWEIARKPIEFQKTVMALEEKGAYTYIDLGPSGTLTNFVKYNLGPESGSTSLAFLNPFGRDIDSFKKIKDYFPGGHSSPVMKKLMNEERKMTTYVFPGQGSQKKGMGADLFDEFKELTAQADAILGYSIKDLCLEDPDNKLGQTQFTQPALFTVNALTYLKKIQETGQKPVYVAGHSLGEYNALFAGGAFDFETGLKMVKKRGELMSRASGGGMAAVIGLSDEQVDAILKDNGLTTISVANYNSPGQIVVAGPKEDIDNAADTFDKGGATMYIPLKVSGAFHSPYMNEAKEEFAEFLKGIEFSDLTIPVIANVTARPYKQDEIRETLGSQITSSVKWTEIIRYFMGLGETEIEEVGPGNVLAKLVKKILKESQPLQVPDNEKPGAPDAKKKAPEPVVETPKESSKKESPKKKSGGTGALNITGESLGSEEYKKEYGCKYAYAAGAMYKGIASTGLVKRMGKAGMMAYYGTGGVDFDTIEKAIQDIQSALSNGEPYGMNLLSNPNEPEAEEAAVDLFLRHGVRNVEAAAFMQMTPALVKFRLKGLSRGSDGSVVIANKIIGKISRPEVAELFLSPAPERVLKKLLDENKITEEEAELALKVPMADDLTVEADSGGHTDMGVAYALMPAMVKLRDDMMKKYGYSARVRVGAAGGIGTPESAAAAFILGADFIVTGSINQCTVEAGTSELVKDLLQQMNVQDTEYAPAGDMFEMGARVQVLRKGLFFPARANKLYDLYRQYNSLDDIDEKTKKQLQEKYFKRSFDDIYGDCKDFYPPEEIEKAERNSKHKMALVFRWYFGYSTTIALSGKEESKVDFQVQCGPALGAFNQWVQGTELEDWRNRHVDEIALKLLEGTAEFLSKRFNEFV